MPETGHDPFHPGARERLVWDSDALMARPKSGDIVTGPDVFDPGPVPPDSEIIGIPKTFLRPRTVGTMVPTMIIALSDSRTAPRSAPPDRLTPGSLRSSRILRASAGASPSGWSVSVVA